MKLFPAKKAIVCPALELAAAGFRPNSFSKVASVPSTKEVVIPYDIPTIELLYMRGIKVDSPIRYEYEFKWAKSSPPFQHQVESADFITRLKRGFIFNDIGTGKTLSTLWAVDYLKRKNLVNKVLIVTTASTMQLVWEETLFTSFPHYTTQLITGSKAYRLKKLQKDADFYIANHDSLKVFCDYRVEKDRKFICGNALDGRDDIDMIIIDESAIFKNARTDLYLALNHVATQARRVWLLSGDPMPNKPTDIWAQARLVNPNIFKRSFTRFRDKVMRKVNAFKWVPRENWEQYVYRELRHYCIRFLRDECVDLPDLIVSQRSCEMSSQQKTLYNDMRKKCRVELEGQSITAVNAAVVIGKLLQISSGCIYKPDGSFAELDVQSKFSVLLEVIEQSHKKLIVIAPFVHTIKMLQAKLEDTWRTSSVYGEVSKPERTKIFSDFQKGNLQILLAHPKVMAHGLDFTAANTICWWSPIDNFELETQANGRITRPGQTSKQTIIQLVSSPIEREIYKRNASKEAIQDKLLNLLSTKV